jgi:uncharacterized repeat protein (TIGR03803 family)
MQPLRHPIKRPHVVPGLVRRISHLTAALVGVAMMMPAINAARGQTVLESFSGTNGSYPMGGLILGGTTIYGMTSEGGLVDGSASTAGTIFSYTPGSGLQTIYDFTGGDGGNQPHHGSLAVQGSTLYGMTLYGGTYNNGNVFSVGTNGTGYQNLYSFTGGADGSQPHGDVVVSGPAIYGMTSGLSSAITPSTAAPPFAISSYGNVFSIGTDGTGMHNLASFTGTDGANPGLEPHTGLIVSGSTVYGMTLLGGTNKFGTLFAVNTDGTGYRNLVSFSGTDGALPAGNLLLSGSTLYGMTSAGGTDHDGTIFSVATDGSGFHDILSFSGTAGLTPGATPWGVLTLSGSTLYGMTEAGGASDLGTVFSVGLDGTGFQELGVFNGANGSSPWGSPILVDSTLYGMTMYGGADNQGVLFAVAVPEPSTYALAVIGMFGLVAWQNRRASWGSSAVKMQNRTGRSQPRRK